MGKLQVDSSKKFSLNPQYPMFKLPLIMLPVRTILFGVIQVLFIYILGFTWKESIAWWPFFAIIANIILFFLLTFLVKKEGMSYLDLIHFDKKEVKQEMRRVLWILPIGGGMGFAGMSFVSYFMYGTLSTPDNMILPLPFWAGVIGFIFFPITNALVEIPTYMGYCFPRLEMIWKSKWAALLLSVFFLAFQHFVLPILLGDVKYMTWHFISFIPLALVVGVIYLKIRRLLSLMLVHWFMDVLAILGVFILSVS